MAKQPGHGARTSPVPNPVIIARVAVKPANSLPLPTGRNRRARWGRLYACAQAEAVIRAVSGHDAPALLIAPDMSTALRREDELRFFAAGQVETFLLPDWETLPYDPFSPREELTAKRIDALCRLPDLRRGVCVAAVDTLLQYVVPPGFLRNSSLSLKVGDRLDYDDFRRWLADHCYTAVSQVSARGECAVRGSVIDFYPPTGKLPVRVNLLDDRIESLRLFDPDRQTSVEPVGAVTIRPAREFMLDEAGISGFRQRFRAEIEAPEAKLYHEISNGIIPGGIEYYLPLFFDSMATLFDYLPENTVIFLGDDAAEHAEEHWKLIRQRYEQARLDRERPLLPPERLFLSAQELERRIRRFARVEMRSFEYPEGRARDGGTRLLPTLFVQEHAKRPLANLQRFLDEFDGRVLVVARSPGYREQLAALLRKAGVRARVVGSWREFLAGTDAVCLCVGEIATGVEFERLGVALVADGQILGRKGEPTRRTTRRTPDADAIIRGLGDLTPGCPVVHEQHGVGRYLGLEHLEVGGSPFEFLVMEYADGDKLYVPISSLNLLTRYTGGDSETAPLHRLGDERWQKAKRKAARKALDVAAELLDTQARRGVTRGVAYAIDGGEQLEFESGFPYEETPDQLKAMDQIRADMRRRRPMDRIVCGDVGFGKTELAMRAAFIAVSNDRQVAVLAPTTLLANQHFESFTSRFADWPVRIELLSRFVSSGRQQRVLESLAAGAVDVVIGTHRLLMKDVSYKRLGLIVVDEEQRFGVRHKERLKSLAAGSDVLTLTATPIPRTLSMSLGGLRELSLITTPPPDRRAIKTLVSEWSDALVSELCQRELHRGGQIYLVHNRIPSIEEMAEHLRGLLPGADVRHAHGQMRERELESVMLDFYRRRFDVLVCTTIIENGIDVPSANSIIINHADRFGLAQLHQLRGRVGRSRYQAYAYLALSEPRARLPEDARKRLEAVESLEQLGTGFTLAAHDLEIRGAGELLGAVQSGHIQEVGFTMYNDLLKRAVEALRAGEIPNADEPLNVVTEVDLGEPALIPEDYVPDVNLRLVMYRRIAAADADGLAELRREMVDRFGPLPDHAHNLFGNAEIRLRCFALGVRRLEVSENGGRLHFDRHPRVDVERLIALVRGQPETYRFNGGDKLTFHSALDEPEQRRRVVFELLEQIGCREAA